MTKSAPKDKRIPKQNVVQGPPALLSKEDAVFSKDGILADNLTFTSSGYLNYGFNEESFRPTIPGPINPNDPSDPTPSVPVIDVPSLADIESIDFEEYADPLTGVSKYKAIIKIRNSSIEKENVEGVDASIYNPSGSATYSFGDSTASGQTTKSNYVSNVTWYNGRSKFNSVTNTITTAPYIVGTAQYPADGKGVPADKITGTSKNKTKNVWRKVQSEALKAARPTRSEL